MKTGMKIDMNVFTFITKPSLKYFKCVSCRFEMRATLPGVDAGPALYGRGSFRTASRGTLTRSK